MKKARNQEKQIEVEVTRQGRHNAPVRRIVPKGTIQIGVGTIDIEGALADNFRVEFVNEGGEVWMQIQTMCNGKGELVAVPQVYKSFNEECFYRTKPSFVRKGPGNNKVPINKDTLCEMREEAHKRRKNAVPRRIVNCPKCGYEFEIGGFSAN